MLLVFYPLAFYCKFLENSLMVGITEISVLLGAVVGIPSTVVAVLKYRSLVELRRAEFMSKLYSDFYEKEHLKIIRSKLDSPEKNQLEKVVEKEMDKKKLSKAEEEELERLVDYLNFFEFALYLRKNKTLRKRDIELMFKFYLDLLGKSKVIRKYISKEGFELLDEYFRSGT